MPATKTYTATVAAFAALAEALGPSPWPARDWDALPDAVQEVVDDLAPAERAAERIGADGVITVGRGFLYSAVAQFRSRIMLPDTARWQISFINQE